jgi:hypothetical protein
MFYNTELQHKLKCKFASVTKLSAVNAYDWVDRQDTAGAVC